MDGSDPNNPPASAPGGAFARKRREKEERAVTGAWPVQQPAPAPSPAPPARAPEPASPAPEPPAPTPVIPAPVVPAPVIREPEPTPPAAPAPMDVVPPAAPAPIAAPEPEPEPAPQPAAADVYETPAAYEPGPVERVETPPEPRHDVEQTATIPAVTGSPEPAARSEKRSKHAKEARPPRQARAPKAPRPAKEPKARKVRDERADRAPRGGRLVPLLGSLVAGACSGGLLVGLVYAFNRWGGQTDSVNAFELLGAFVAAIVVGYVVLAICRVAHRAAVAFLGVGIVAVVLMFFPSDRWETVAGSVIVVAATAVAYAVANTIAREATGEH